MNSDQHEDQNFYSRRPQTSSTEHLSSNSYEPPPLPAFETARSPQLPPKLPFLTTENLKAAASNGFHSVGLTNGGDRDPDNFYRDYRGVQTTAEFGDYSPNDMAADSRPAPPSLRSNGNGTTPKHPPLPQTRTALKPSFRSTSSPLDMRAALNNAKSSPALNGYTGRQSSVKDVVKRFNQVAEQPAPAFRKPSPRINTKDVGSGVTKGFQARNTVGQNVGSTSRAGTNGTNGTSTRRSPPTAKTTQRTRFAAEDQHSNNTRSGVARATRPRNTVSGSITASKSMTNLSPTSPNAPTQPSSRRPLFGEVLPIDQGHDIGYGIPHSAARRTSDSGLHPTWTHQRSKSDLDTSPSSPTAWYLGATALDDVDTNKEPKKDHQARPPSHNRAHSDFADTKVNTMNGVNPAFQLPQSPTTSPTQPTSKIPIQKNRFSSSSESSQPSRATSPFTAKALPNGKLRKPERPWSPSGRITPTSRAKTPTHPSPRGKAAARAAEKSTQNNGSVKAYISAPPPKLSPSLRSSHSRQPVSSASTVSSRQRVSDRPMSPPQYSTGMKITRNNVEAKGRKERQIPEIPLGEINFEARRSDIRRAYTLSIDASQQKAIREANRQRLIERENAAKAVPIQDIPKDESSLPTEIPPMPEIPQEPKATPPLTITTSFYSANLGEAERHQAVNGDSPTLGVPGSFVEDDECPVSAISNVTGFTDIENEPQTEVARVRLNRMPSALSSHVKYSDDQFSPEQASYGIDNMDQESIQIMLDATPVDEFQPEATPTNDAFARDPSPPGAFKESPDFDQDPQPMFASTLTTASPYGHPPHSREPTALETGNAMLPQVYLEETLPEVFLPQINDYFNNSEAPRIELPLLRTALAPPSLTPSESGLNTPVTDIDYESSDGVGPSHMMEDRPDERAYDTFRQPSTQNYPPNRLSAWTDYSVGTGDEYSEQEDFSHSYVQTTSEQERKPIPPPKEPLVLSPLVPPKPDGYSPQPSPRFVASPTRFDSPATHRLPPISTGHGIGLDFSEESPNFGTVTIPLAPTHSPPPLPEPGQPSPVARRSPPLSFYNRRPTSSIFNTSQNGSGQNGESRRPSDDVGSSRTSMSIPHSSPQASFTDSLATTLGNTRPNTIAEPQVEGSSLNIPLQSVQTEEEKKPSDEDAKRLFQRRKIIEEFIDTESVYLKDMNVVEEIYKGTAEACPKLDAGDIKAIFRNSDEIIAFSTMFLDELKSAGCSVYSPRTKRQGKATNGAASAEDRLSIATTVTSESDEQKDRKTFIGAVFGKHLYQMQSIYTDFLRNSEIANSRLDVLQSDGAVKVWLSECNLVAKDLTMAWDLNALLVKPVQRITRYQLLLNTLRVSTPRDHPDFEALEVATSSISVLLTNIDSEKERIHKVGKIMGGRKRKESDVRSGLAKLTFGRRTTADKLRSDPNRPPDDEVYVKLEEKFGDDFLRLQVVLRDVEFYTRQISTYVSDFLRYLSSMELVMRLGATNWPEIESKWARFSMSMRDIGTVVLEDHISGIRKRVIEPFEKVISLYNPPSLAMKKRNKRRLDHEKFLELKSANKKIDDRLKEMVAQYEALNETLKLELPKLSSMTGIIGNVCLVQLVQIQAAWWKIWQEKVRSVLEESRIPKEIEDIVDMFRRDFAFEEGRIQQLGIINGSFSRGSVTRSSQSAHDDDSLRTKGRPSNLSSRSRGLSINSDKSPSLPTPDFLRNSGGFMISPVSATAPTIPQVTYSTHSRAGSNSPATPDIISGSQGYARPATGRSGTSETAGMRAGNDYNHQYRRESGSTSYSYRADGPPMSSRPMSGLFNSALPVEDNYDSRRSSRASSRERAGTSRYNVLYLAASLFEFNISATKTEAGYPYLTYQAGEIFDVIGEKGELWLAKNQDDPSEEVGWIWSKHFARLA